MFGDSFAKLFRTINPLKYPFIGQTSSPIQLLMNAVLMLLFTVQILLNDVQMLSNDVKMLSNVVQTLLITIQMLSNVVQTLLFDDSMPLNENQMLFPHIYNFNLLINSLMSKFRLIFGKWKRPPSWIFCTE